MFLLVGLAACKSDRPKVEENETELVGDSVSRPDTAVLRAPFEVYPQADGLFNDFIDRFMSDDAFQYDRIEFPLKQLVNGEETKIDRAAWQYDSIYSDESDYTLIFDAPDVQKETVRQSLKSATVELVDLKMKRLKKYKFEHCGEHWLLTLTDEHDFSHDGKHDFYEFYSKFVSDVKFQVAHVQDPFIFKTYDSDNFEEIEGNVSAEQWVDFRPELPVERITNTIYNDEVPKSNYRTFVVVSPSSEMNCILVFKRVRGRWGLVSLEN